MSKYSINGTTLDNIAAPIMSMRGLTGGLTPEEMGTNANAVMANVTDALNAIAAKGVDITGMNSDNLAALIAALATLPALTTPGVAADLRTGKQLIDGSGNIVTGTMPEQDAQTITPGTSDKTIASGRYLTGTQTIKGDSNLVASNIVSGKTIFGVAGSYTGGAKYVTGSFTIETTYDMDKTVTLTHNLKVVPNFVVVFTQSFSNYSSGILPGTVAAMWFGGYSYYFYFTGSTNSYMKKESRAITTAKFNCGIGAANSVYVTCIMVENTGFNSYFGGTFDYIIGVL